MDLFYETVQQEAPGAWDLNLALPGLWNPDALEHHWALPDNYNCHIKVEGVLVDDIHVLGAPMAIRYTVNRPLPSSKSLCPHLTHSVDGFVVREMHRRCSFQAEDYDRSMNALKKYLRGHVVGKGTKTKDDKLVMKLCEREAQSGFLSARILSCVSQENIGHLSHDQLRKLRNLLTSLPKKSFPIMSIHD